MFGEWQIGQGALALPNLELVHQAYSQVLSIAVVVQGLHMSVTVLRLQMALLIEVCSWSDVKNLSHFLWRILGSSRL